MTTLLTEPATVAAVPKVSGSTSDGYHTFDELYEHRYALFGALCVCHPCHSYKSRLHHDGTMFDDSFIMVLEATSAHGDIRYHLPMSEWDRYPTIRERERAKVYDGAPSSDTVKRLHKMIQSIVTNHVAIPMQDTETHTEWKPMERLDYRSDFIGNPLKSPGSPFRIHMTGGVLGDVDSVNDAELATLAVQGVATFVPKTQPITRLGLPNEDGRSPILFHPPAGAMTKDSSVPIEKRGDFVHDCDMYAFPRVVTKPELTRAVFRVMRTACLGLMSINEAEEDRMAAFTGDRECADASAALWRAMLNYQLKLQSHGFMGPAKITEEMSDVTAPLAAAVEHPAVASGL